MSNLLTKALLILTLLIGTAAFAGQDKEGGEPEALEFIRIGRQIQSWLAVEQSKYFEVNQIFLKVVLDRIEASLSKKDQVPMIEFKDRPKDKNLVQKFVVYSEALGRIEVDLNSWVHATEQKRYEAVATELLGLSGLKNRYEFVRLNISPNIEKIKSVKTSEFASLQQDYFKAKGYGYGQFTPDDRHVLAENVASLAEQYSLELVSEIAPKHPERPVRVAIQSEPYVPTWGRAEDVSAITFVKYRFTNQRHRLYGAGPGFLPDSFGDITCRIETKLGYLGFLPMTFTASCAQLGTTEHQEFQAVGFVCQKFEKFPQPTMAPLQVISRKKVPSLEELTGAIEGCQALK